MYMLTNPLYPLFNSKIISHIYPNIKKIKNIDSYSSDKVKRISKNELKKIITKSGLL